MKAVRRHTDCKWVLLYLQRWLEAPVRMPDGTLAERERGTPQGTVVSQVLANLFLHYVFDLWMRRDHPDIPFERYADDVICHCRSEVQARGLHQALEARFAECALRLHPEKTKIVYCKDANRPGTYPEQSFDFLGYHLSGRDWRTTAAANGSSLSFRQSAERPESGCGSGVRRWRRHRRSDLALEEVAAWVRPVLTGLVRYYGKFYPSKLREELPRSMPASFDGRFANTSGSRATRWRHGSGYARSSDAIHTCLLTGRWDPRLDDGSRINREVHVRFWESARLRCLAPLAICTATTAYHTHAPRSGGISTFTITAARIRASKA